MAEMQMAIVGAAGIGPAPGLPDGVAGDSAGFFMALAAQLAAGKAGDPSLLSAEADLPAGKPVSGKGNALLPEAGDVSQAAPGLDPMLWLVGMPMVAQALPMPGQGMVQTAEDAPLSVALETGDEAVAGALAGDKTGAKAALAAVLARVAPSPEFSERDAPRQDGQSANLAGKGQDLPVMTMGGQASQRTLTDLNGRADSPSLPPVSAGQMVPDAGEALRAMTAQRPAEVLSRAADVGVRATVDAPVRSSAFVAEFGDRLVWAASRHAQIAEISLTPPHLGSVEVRLSMNGNEAGAQFYSPHANVREILEQAMPRLKEIMAEAGIQLGQAQVNDQAFARREPSLNQGAGALAAGDEPDSAMVRGIESTHPVRVGQGLVDLYA